MNDDLLQAAVDAARAGAAVLRRYFRTALDLDVRQKGKNDFVTRADGESEAAIVGLLRERFPDHHVLAEERGVDAGGESEFEWVIDPLDGTTNFLAGLPVYCVSIACRRGRELLAGAVLDPEGGNLFTASAGGGARWNDRPMAASRRPGLAGAFLATGYPYRAHRSLDLYLAAFRDIFLEVKAIRRCGSAALDLAYTAAGVYDGFFEFRLSPWDIAAGMLLVREAGGAVTDVDGGDGSFASGNVVAGGLGVQADLRATIARHASEGMLAALESRERAD